MSVRLPLACLAVLALAYTPARADIPVPPPPADVKFKIEVDEKAKGPVLRVPENLVAPRAGGRPKGPLADNHLMVAGVALALGLGLGGVWLVRRPGRGTRGLALLIAAGGVLAAGSVAWANQAAPKPPVPAPLPIAFDGQVRLEVVAAGDTIRLIVDQETYEQMKKDLKK
jgi:hypothetical protein